MKASKNFAESKIDAISNVLPLKSVFEEKDGPPSGTSLKRQRTEDPPIKSTGGSI